VAMNDRFDDDWDPTDPRLPAAETPVTQQFTSHDDGQDADGPGGYATLDSVEASAFDDVDSRAAHLMAQIAAKRLQHQASPPDSADDGYPPQHDWEPEPEAVESPTSMSEAPIDTDDNTDDITEILPTIPEQEPVESDDAVTDDPERQLPTRRMALPPWQVPPAMGGELDEPDAQEPPAEIRSPDVDREEPQANSGPPPLPLPPGWPPALPPPPPGWQGAPPPAGWPPGLPPPPPGWQGMPPWMPARGALPPRAAPGQDCPPSPHGPDESDGLRRKAGRHSVRPPGHSSLHVDHPAPQAGRMAPSLDEAEMVSRERPAPQSGWQRAVHSVTGGWINPGPSRKERERQELIEHIRQPFVGDFRIAVLSIKGGVGKTTTTLGLGSALATVRSDRVIAVDANPDCGTLAERVLDTSTSSTVRDLLRDPNIKRYADVRNHTRMASSRLEVLASEQDPAVAEVFGEADYRRTMDILRYYYNVILTDCGTGIMHSAMAGVLELAHSIVLVSSPAIDAARSASATLDWLVQHGRRDLVREAHVVLSASRPGSATLKLDKVFEHFEARCASIHVIPFEPHLAEGADFDFGLLKPATAQAYLGLAGAVSGKFGQLGSPQDVRA
jgi:MinD-like ATPase involved in chromosome partitioning or flagellar assembly